VDADEYADVVGGPTTPAGVAVHYRKGPKFPQVGFGQIFDTGVSPYWSWVSPDTILKVHHVSTSAGGGDIIGAHIEVKNEAGSGGAGVVPDSSALTAIMYQTAATADGATRALEAQTIVDTLVSNANANSSSYAVELGIHSAKAGNGSYKTGVLNCYSTGSGIPSGTPGVRADVGLLLRGEAGYTWPIRFWDEKTTGKFLFNVQQDGRVLGSYLGTAAAPAYSFYSSQFVEVGRTAVEATLAVSGGASSFVTGDVAGDAVLKGSQKLMLGVGTTSMLNLTTLGVESTAGVVESNVVSPSTITSNQDNYAPTGITTARTLQLGTDASRNITGFSASQTTGRMLRIINTGSFNIVLQHETTSTAANRINTHTGADHTVGLGRSVDMMYQSSSRWRIVSAT
jgi:hypothetical protein